MRSGRLGGHLCLVNEKPARPDRSRTLGPPRLISQLWPWPCAWPPFGRQSRLERPWEGSLLSGGPGLWLTGSPCWPEATWVPRCWVQPALGWTTHSPAGAVPTDHCKVGDNKQQRPKTRDLKGIRKCAEVGGPLEEVVGEEGLPPGAFGADGCKGQVFKRQVGALQVPFSLPRSPGASKPLLLKDAPQGAHGKGPVPAPAQDNGGVLVKGS